MSRNVFVSILIFASGVSSFLLVLFATISPLIPLFTTIGPSYSLLSFLVCYYCIFNVEIRAFPFTVTFGELTSLNTAVLSGEKKNDDKI